MPNISLARCIEKYGEERGRAEYDRILDNRIKRASRRKIENARTYADIEEGRAVRCCECNGIFTRITPSHLRSGCNVRATMREYRTKYPDAKILSDAAHEFTRITSAGMADKFGEEHGASRWEKYTELQAETNTYEYKSRKFGMSDEDFSSYNASRASTLENFIMRYGEEIGRQKWESYRERQRYTVTEEYFIETYGPEEGPKKFKKFVNSRVYAKKTQSKIELAVFKELSTVLPGISQSIRLYNPYYGPYDFGSLERKKLIEFYGSYWHADPLMYEPKHFFKQKNMTASLIWSRDSAKRTYAEDRGFSVYVIWESRWRKEKASIIADLKAWWS